MGGARQQLNVTLIAGFLVMALCFASSCNNDAPEAARKERNSKSSSDSKSPTPKDLNSEGKSASEGEDEVKDQEVELTLADRTKEILQKSCASCHGEGGSTDGGLDYVTDLAKLVDKKMVVPEDPEQSLLYQRIENGTMPPGGQILSKGEMSTIKSWIKEGAKSTSGRINRKFVSESEIYTQTANDLTKSFQGNERRNIRYFSLVHLYNAGLEDSYLESVRQGLAKLMNSLSMGANVVPLMSVNNEKTLLRINLKDYGWDNNKWNMVLKTYVYMFKPTDAGALSVLQDDTNTPVPVVRADWFIAKASKTPLYYDLLGLPETVIELERMLDVKATENIRSGTLSRAGFNNSNGAEFGRVIERHASKWGAYWKSYEFASSSGPQNIFMNPFGPKGVFAGNNNQNSPDLSAFDAKAFTSGGNEMIFNLPNGLFGFYISDQDGKRRLDAPATLRDGPVQEAKVTPGVSCGVCHSKGLIEKKDQIRDTAVASNSFSAVELDMIKKLYTEKDAFRDLILDDSKKFRQKLSDAKVTMFENDPVIQVFRRFPMEVDLYLAAAELGVEPDRLKQLIKDNPKIAAQFAMLLANSAINRVHFEVNFPDLIKAIYGDKAIK